MTTQASAKRDSKPGRTNDPERTKQDILAIATTEFAEKGLSGARIDDIAALTKTSKRMIYYYFGGKEELYLAVLEEAYRRIRSIENDLHLADFPPEEAMRKLVAFTFDYQAGNPDFIRLVMNENMHNGQYLAKSTSIKHLNSPAINAVRDIYARGCIDGIFRPGLDPVDIHMSISALCFFNVSNKHTFSLIFKRKLSTIQEIEQRRQNIVELIVRYLKA